MALWESDGTTQISCDRYVGDGDDVNLNASALTIGNWYYISVDVQDPSRAGTFTLCIDNPVDYDWYDGAIDVSSIINSCSADAAYSTVDASPDGTVGSCWNNGGPDNNRWFKFQAVDGTASVKIDIGGTKGTQTRTQLALWEADGITEISCNRYAADGDDVNLNSSTLSIVNWYYISVDVQSPSRAGTFTLCIDNLGSALPITLLSFQAKVLTDTRVELTWETASEINNDYFTIERSLNGTDWEIITIIDGAGNSNTILAYSTLDNSPYNGVSYYRLKQTDFDGQFEYSIIRSVTVNKVYGNEVQIYPNPTNSQITIQTNKQELSSFRIYNAFGQDVTNKAKQLSKSDNILLIDLSNLVNGIYTVKTATAANKVYKQ